MTEVPFPIGSKIDRYRLDAELGSDELSRIFRAHDTILGRDVVLKLIVHSRSYSPGFKEQFLKETRAVAHITHPNIARILDFGQEQGYLFLVSEFVPGETLETRLSAGQKTGWREIVELLIPITEALEKAHEAGIIHQDLKPANIILTPEGKPVITDFSIARILEPEETRGLTGTHVGLGSPHYMSPEQGRGLDLDDRADIYALGTIFYEWVTGQKPFASGRGMEIVIQKVSVPVKPPRQIVPDLPSGVEKILLTMLCKDREERYQAMADVTDDLREVLVYPEGWGAKKQTPHALRWVAGLAGLAVLLAAGVLGLRALEWGPFAPAPPIPVATATLPTETPALASPQSTATPNATATLPAPTETAAVAPTIQVTPAAAYIYPQYPKLEKTSLPKSTVRLAPDNAAGMIELARWGNPAVRAVAWSKDDAYLFAATAAGLYMYEASSLSPISSFDAGRSLTALAISRDNRLLATGDDQGVIRLWDPLTATLLKEMPGHTGPILALNFSADGARLASASKDKTARLWNDIGELMAVLEDHDAPVTGAVFLPGDQEFVTVSEDDRLMRWSSATGERTGAWPGEVKGYLLDVAVALDAVSQQALVVSSKPRLELWEFTGGSGVDRNYTEIDNRGTQITSIAISPNSTRVAFATGDGRVQVINLGGQSLISPETGPVPAGQQSSYPIDLAFSNDSTRLVGLLDNGTLIVWDAITGERRGLRQVQTTQISAFDISPDGEHLAVLFPGPFTQWFNTRDGVPGRRFNGELPRGTTTGRVDRASQWAAVARQAAETIYPVLALEALDSRLPRELVGYGGGPARFLDNQTMLAAGSDRSIQLWALESLYSLQATRYTYLNNCQVAYDLDGNLLAAGSRLGVFVSPDRLDFFCRQTWIPYTADWAYVDGGRWLAYGLTTGEVVLTGQGEDGATITHRFRVAGGGVSAVALSPDERLLAAGCKDGTIQMWSVEAQELLTPEPLGNHTGAVTDLLFSPDGAILYSTSADGTLEVWGLAK